MFYKLLFDNSDFDKYRNDYYDLKNLSDKELWEHWNNYGYLENRILYIKFTLADADLKKYKNDYKI